MRENLLLLKKGPNQALEKIYTGYRKSFLQFARKYELDDDILIKIYQDSFIALREHAIKGKLDHIKSSIKTYLYNIGEYKIHALLKKQKTTAYYEKNKDFINSKEIIDVFEEPKLSVEQKLLQKHFMQLGKRCQELLTLFYYRGLTIKEIADSQGYENKNIVKNQKSHCLKLLIKISAQR